MTVTFIGASSETRDSTGSNTVPKPGGVAAGDLLVAVFVQSVNTGPSGAPDGTWTTVYDSVHPSTPYLRLAIWTRPATASEPSSYVFTGVGNADSFAAVLAYRGAFSSVVSGVNVGQSTTWPAPSVDATGQGTAVRIFTAYASSASLDFPAGTTERAVSLVGTAYTLVAGVADEPVGGAGAVGVSSVVFPSSRYYFAATLALEAANATPDAPILTAPADGGRVDRNSTNRFDWDFSDPDAGDSQSAYNLRYRTTGAWTETGWQASPNTYHDIAAGTFDAGDFEWQVATKDAQGQAGPYSPSSFFSVGDAPPGPTITDPTNGQTIAAETYLVAWSAPDQDAYQLRRVADNAGAADTGTIYYDTGTVEGSIARSRLVSFPANNRFEHVQVRVRFGGLWSQWASVRVQVSWTAPPAPSFSLLPDADAGALLVSITNPVPVGDEPSVSYNDVFIDDGDGEERRATLVTPNSSWTYHLPISGRDYAGNVRVVAVGDNGTTAST